MLIRRSFKIEIQANRPFYTLLCLLMLIGSALADPAPQPAAKGITIVKALYGSDEQFAKGDAWDVTEITQKRIVDGKLHIHHTRNAFGDPHPYKSKVFKVLFLLDGKHNAEGKPFEYQQWAGMVDLGSSLPPFSLAFAANHVVKDLPRGCVVTGELIAGEAKYSMVGPDQPAGVPAEKVIFEIGSITKTFTGILLAQAVLEKKLNFETTLKQALGEKQVFVDPRVASITLAQLATHTSGLPVTAYNVRGYNREHYANLDYAELLKWLSTYELEKDPPHDYSYSNVGVGLLGLILEHALGDNWGNLVQARICKPLGMHDTVIKLNEEQQKRLAPPNKGAESDHTWNFKAYTAGGALRSTAADMMIYAIALKNPEKTPLTESIKLALKPLSKSNGCCIFIGNGNFWHSGGTGGYNTLLQVLPSREQVRIVLINNRDFKNDLIIKEFNRRNLKLVP